MTNLTPFMELRERSKAGIFAVPYRNRRPRKALRLPDGAIVEAPTIAQRGQAPDAPDDCVLLARDGRPATIHHVNLGLTTDFVPFEGVYLISTGDVAAVYGAEAIPIS